MAKEQNIDPDLRSLAEEALDLWQDYLDSYSSDPKARTEMAKMMAPMNQMFAQWAGFMQHGINGAKPDVNEPSKQESTPPADNQAALERRVAELESRLAKFESFMASLMAVQAKTTKPKT
ncbi:MAG: hypothetical protein PHX43_06275 [Alphaproteobacteria bacterium]|nr:hypothetical protein [Alphaproteobacteria bacterium]